MLTIQERICLIIWFQAEGLYKKSRVWWLLREGKYPRGFFHTYYFPKCLSVDPYNLDNQKLNNIILGRQKGEAKEGKKEGIKEGGREERVRET